MPDWVPILSPVPPRDIEAAQFFVPYKILVAVRTPNSCLNFLQTSKLGEVGSQEGAGVDSMLQIGADMESFLLSRLQAAARLPPPPPFQVG